MILLPITGFASDAVWRCGCNENVWQS